MKKIFFILLVFVSGCGINKEKKKSKKQADHNSNTKTELINLANASYEKDNYQEAIQYLTKLINLDPLNGEYHYKRGYSLSENSIDRREASVVDFLIAAEQNYRPGDAYYNIGLNFIALWDDSLALFSFHKSLQYDSLEDQIVMKMIADCKKRQEEVIIRRSESPMYKE
ncbi:tetratricopeptide repeat protein, partial [Xanthovirga aplysinae]|uniref:tetratricopeptide repeat protein n=1 Tax=Xanthovirga aplysinae TaxID=2529853 RepID=UPI001CA39A43